MKENFPNFVKEIDRQTQETQGIPNKMDAEAYSKTHIISKMPKVEDKKRILPAAREKKLVTDRRVPIRQLISQKKLQTRRDWQEIFKVMKSKDLQPRLLYLGKVSKAVS